LRTAPLNSHSTYLWFLRPVRYITWICATCRPSCRTRCAAGRPRRRRRPAPVSGRPAACDSSTGTCHIEDRSPSSATPPARTTCWRVWPDQVSRRRHRFCGRAAFEDRLHIISRRLMMMLHNVVYLTSAKVSSCRTPLCLNTAMTDLSVLDH